MLRKVVNFTSRKITSTWKKSAQSIANLSSFMQMPTKRLSLFMAYRHNIFTILNMSFNLQLKSGKNIDEN